jgi:hypothetical protein
MVASISLLQFNGFSYLFRAIFVGFSCAVCSFDSEVFGFGFVGGDHG